MREAERKAAAILQKIASGDIQNAETVFTYKDPPLPEEADAQAEDFRKRINLRAARNTGAIY